MTSLELAYFAISLTGLGVLCLIVRQMGLALSDCPDTGRAARAGSLVIMTGFGAIGFGIISLIAAMLPVLTAEGVAPLYVALGCVGIALGIGFAWAAENLRRTVQAAADRVDAARKTISNTAPEAEAAPA